LVHTLGKKHAMHTFTQIKYCKCLNLAIKTKLARHSEYQDKPHYDYPEHIEPVDMFVLFF
jgi:hypothetical protein